MVMKTALKMYIGRYVCVCVCVCARARARVCVRAGYNQKVKSYATCSLLCAGMYLCVNTVFIKKKKSYQFSHQLSSINVLHQ